MEGWYDVSFSTDNWDIVNLIKNIGVDFDYHKDEEWGCCRLKYGIYAFDMNTIKMIAEEQHATFIITVTEPITHDSYIWKFKNGKEVRFEKIEKDLENDDVDEIGEHELTDYDRQCYIEGLKNAAQYILDNAEEFISGIEDNTTELDFWIRVDEGDVILQREYSRNICSSRNGLLLKQSNSKEYSF